MSGDTASALIRAAWGAVLVSSPSRALSRAGHPSPSRTARTVVRVLGARHLAQAGVELIPHSRTVSVAGGVVDSLHSLSDVAVAALSPRWRTAAACDAVLAASFAFIGYRNPSRLVSATTNT
jgi:hypothetical protein